MLKDVLVALVALAVASLSPAVRAQTAGAFYIGGGLGVGTAGLSSGDFDFANSLNVVAVNAPSGPFDPLFGSSMTYTKTAFGAKAFAGYAFNPYLAVEGGYAWLGNHSVNVSTTYGGIPSGGGNGTYKIGTWLLEGVAKYPFGDGFDFHLKLGVAFTNAKTRLSVNSFLPDGTPVPQSLNGSKNVTNAAAGLGAGYQFTSHLAANVEYENFGTVGSASPTGRASAGLWSVNLLYAF